MKENSYHNEVQELIRQAKDKATKEQQLLERDAYVAGKDNRPVVSAIFFAGNEQDEDIKRGGTVLWMAHTFLPRSHFYFHRIETPDQLQGAVEQDMNTSNIVVVNVSYNDLQQHRSALEQVAGAFRDNPLVFASHGKEAMRIRPDAFGLFVNYSDICAEFPTDEGLALWQLQQLNCTKSFSQNLGELARHKMSAAVNTLRNIFSS